MSRTEDIKSSCNERVQVIARCRPMSEKEKLKGYVSVLKVHPDRNAIEIYDPKREKLDHCKVFTFDRVYGWQSEQKEIYDKMVQPIVTSVLDGFNCTVFAYGQSSAGKTYTMEGDPAEENNKGIIPKSFEQIFDHIATSCNMQYLVRVSYLEIYQDEIRDLLSKNQNKKYELRENKESGVYVKNISSFVCKSVSQMQMLMNTGRQNRAVGITEINERSSRSHAIFSITIDMTDLEVPFESRIRVGKLNLVDLAGSERQNKSNTEGKSLKEASKINLSLTALGNVISALAESKGNYVPYRDSKLTRLLRDSLGGNSKTLMIASIGPASYNYDESLNTLRYASRARNIRNKPQINEDPFDTLLRKYQEEIRRLKQQLAGKTTRKKEQDMIFQSTLVHNVGTYNTDLSLLSRECKTGVLETNGFEITETIKNVIQCNAFPIENNNLLVKEQEGELGDEEMCEKLIKQIQTMESKILTGTSNILEHTSKQKKMLEAKINEILEVKKREKYIQVMLDFEEETTEEIKEEFLNMQQEVEIKSKKLLKLNQNVQSIQQEILDVKEEFNMDRRELEITKYELIKELKLRLLKIRNFISIDERRKISSKLCFNEDSDSWEMMPSYVSNQMLPKPQCVEYMRRPSTLFTVFSRRKANHIFRCEPTDENRDKTFRFKGEDILELSLVGTSHSTQDYEQLSSTLIHLFKNALKKERDIDIDAASLSSTTKRLSTFTLSSGNSLLKSEVLAPIYPKTRGLVPK